MSNNKRRDFVKTCGIGLGVAMSSGLWANNMLANSALDSGKGLPRDTVDTFGLSTEEMQKLLDIALSKGGEFSELYFEHTENNDITMSEDIIKSSSQSIDRGVGVRVIKGTQQGYAYTNDITFEKIKEVALAAAEIADGNAKVKAANLEQKKVSGKYYVLNNLMTDKDLDTKIALIRESYEAAKKYDNKIVKVNTSLLDSVQTVTIANSLGLLITDYRPQVRLVTRATAEKNGVRGTGSANNGGRTNYDFYKSGETPKSIGERAAKEALELLEADFAPAGEYTVVLSKHQSGVMIHEAVGHPLEADANWKKQSVMAGRMGEKVGSELISIYDDATIPDFRGSLNIDDEGVQCENVQLIEKGKLVGYLNDRLSAKIMKTKPNGHGRRESYRNIPIPRMNNTMLAKGESTPEEVIASVKKGFYAKTYQGGMVDNTGKFTFSVNLGYLIENGKITKPLRNATLIGSNIGILKYVDMVANDTGIFLGTCGKSGQSVPVTAGTPTLRIKKMTVGGV